jgi:hypothetical protein
MKRGPWHAEPFELRGVPAMVSREEQRYLHWLGRTQWRDEGHVVEIGPWLGGSTVCLASGMRISHPLPRHRLHAFDNFVWREFMARFAALPLKPGESFERFFLDNVAAQRELVVAHAAKLPDEKIAGDPAAERSRGIAEPDVEPFAWNSGAIEILFVDGAKSWRGMRWLLRSVAASLIPGRTLLVAQDFKHWGSSWVPLMIARMTDALELSHVVERGSTVTFVLREPLDPARFDALEDDVAELDTAASLDDLERMARWVGSRGDEVGAGHVRLGQVQLLAHHGRLEQAAARFEELRATWPLRGAKGQLEGAQRYLVERGAAVQRLGPWSRVRGLVRRWRTAGVR